MSATSCPGDTTCDSVDVTTSQTCHTPERHPPPGRNNSTHTVIASTQQSAGGTMRASCEYQTGVRAHRVGVFHAQHDFSCAQELKVQLCVRVATDRQLGEHRVNVADAEWSAKHTQRR